MAPWWKFWARKADVRIRRGWVRSTPVNTNVTLTLGRWQIIAVEVTSPDPFVVSVSGTQQITVEVLATRYITTEDAGVILEQFVLDPVEAGVTYTSANASIASVTSGGLIEGVAQGDTTVTVKAGGITDLIAVTVNNTQTVASVDVSPTSASTGVGGTAVFSAVVRNSGGQQLTGKTVTWNSATTSVATIGSDSGTEAHQATATGVAAGTSNITATSETIQSTARVLTITSSSGTLYFADKFDSGNFSKNMNNWRWNAAGNVSVVADTGPFGTDTYVMLHRHGTGNPNTEKRIIHGQNVTGYFFGFYRRYPSNYFHRNGPSTDNNKFWRVWGGDTADGNMGYGDYATKGGFSTTPSPSTGGGSNLIPEYGYSTTCSAGSGVGQFGNAGTNEVFLDGVAAWYKIMGHLQLSSAIGVNDGIIKCWINDVLRLNYTTEDWYPRCTSGTGRGKFYWHHTYVHGAANSGWDYTQDIYTARLRIASTYELADPDNTTGW